MLRFAFSAATATTISNSCKKAANLCDPSTVRIPTAFGHRSDSCRTVFRAGELNECLIPGQNMGLHR